MGSPATGSVPHQVREGIIVELQCQRAGLTTWPFFLTSLEVFRLVEGGPITGKDPFQPIAQPKPCHCKFSRYCLPVYLRNTCTYTSFTCSLCLYIRHLLHGIFLLYLMLTISNVSWSVNHDHSPVMVSSKPEQILVWFSFDERRLV